MAEKKACCAAALPPAQQRRRCLRLLPSAAWELVAGEEAWRGMHPMQIIVQVTQGGARPPPLPDCPPPLAALMAACWAEEPADRWAGQQRAAAL